MQSTPRKLQCAVQQLEGMLSPAFCLAKLKQETLGNGPPQPEWNSLCTEKSPALCRVNEPVSRLCAGHFSIIEMQPSPVQRVASI